jgi:hypothetical protein
MMSEAADQQANLGGQAKSMVIPKRWPLVNTLTSRNAKFDKDARLINAYAEKDPVTNQYNVEKRPGFAPAASVVGTLGGQGLFSFNYLQLTGSVPFLGYNTIIIYIQGTQGLTNSAAFSLVVDALGGLHSSSLGPVNLGYINPSGGGPGSFPTKAQFLGIPTGGLPIILFGSGAAPTSAGPLAYWYNAGVLHTLTPGVNGFPKSTVPGFVYLDGFTYVMDISGTIWQTTTQNQVANWGVLAFISAASEADLAVQLARQLIYVVAIKQWTTQFFYDAGNPTGSSLSPVPGAIYNYGCLSADTFQDLDGILFWATQSKSGTYRITMVNNLQDRFISTPAVERQLDLGPGSIWYSQAFQHAGHRWYLITNVTTNVTMVYDIGENLWYLWTDFKGNFYPVISRCSGPSGVEWHQMAATGSIYQLDADYVYPNDFGNIVPVDIYTPNFDAGVDRLKMLSQMRFDTDQQPQSKLYIRSSDDDYQTWNSYREVDLNQQTPIINDEGSFYRRAYNFHHYANTKLRIRAVDLQMDIGTL